MKKTYIIPVNKVYNVQTTSMMATSGASIQSGGSNKEGGPTVAETHEWRGSSSVMGNEW